MYKSEHTEFILCPLSSMLQEGLSACKGLGNAMNSYPLCDYITQSLFLRLTGALEQKMKCICWELATVDYEYRYEFLKKDYGECSDWKSKNGVYNDLINAIKKVEPSFEPASLFDAGFIESIKTLIYDIYMDSILEEWQKKELDFYTSHISTFINSTQVTPAKQSGAKSYVLYQNLLKDKFEEIVYKHRNRCAHNTFSYQRNKPDLSVISREEYMYHNYFFRYAIVLLTDEIFVALLKKYLLLQNR